MTNVGKVLFGSFLLGGAYLAYRHFKEPHNAVPAGGGQPTPIPPKPTPDNPHPAEEVTVLSLPQLEARSGVQDMTPYAGTPIRNLPNGATTLVAMSWPGQESPHNWWPVPMTIIDEDPDASRGYATAKVGENFAVPGGPAPGTQISLSTATDDDVANINPNAPGTDAMLTAQGF